MFEDMTRMELEEKERRTQLKREMEVEVQRRLEEVEKTLRKDLMKEVYFKRDFKK
jgi:hypothetical protein